MRVGFLTLDPFSPGSLRVADSLRASPVGLAAILAARGTGSTSRSGRAAARRLAGAIRARFASSSGPTSAREYAKRHGIAFEPVPAPNHARTAEAVRMQKLEVVVCYAAGILRPILLEAGGASFVNAHAGRLPGYGGMNVVEWAAYRGDPVYGTIHKIDSGIDTGDLLDEAPLALGRPRTIEELRAAAFAEVWGMLPAALAGLAEGRLRFRPQPDAPRFQWFRMHPRLLRAVQSRLDDGSFYATQEASAEAARRAAR